MSLPEWRRRLRPASLRGVKFEVDSLSIKGGRRNVKHEYPQRDRGYVEDLGLKLRDTPIVGFVIGDDWQTRIESLIAACERGGPARLEHPVFGVLSVAVESYDVEIASTDGRMAKITLELVEAGDLQFPTGESSTSAALATASSSAQAATSAAFVATFSTAGPGFVAAAAVAQVSAQVANARKALLRAGSNALANPAALAVALDELEAQAAALVATPAALVTQTAAVFEQLDGLAILAKLAANAGQVSAGTAATPTEQQILDNAAAVQRLWIRSALVAACALVSTATFESYDEAIALRDTLAAGLDAEAESADDDTFEALSALRLALASDVELRAAELVRLRSWTIPGVTSTLQAAQDLYGDGSREAEIEARNLPPHPGFLSGSITVATT